MCTIQRKAELVGLIVFSVLVGFSAVAAAQEQDLRGELDELRRTLDEQKRQIEAQQRLIETQQRKLDELEGLLKQNEQEKTTELQQASQQITDLRKQVEQVAERAPKEPEPTDFKAFWKEGLRLETTDRQFQLRFGGRMQADAAWMSPDSDVRSTVGDLEDGTEFRRARFYTSGRLYDNTDFKLEFDFASGDSDLTDAYIGLRDLPAYLKLGHFKEPFSIEELTSCNYVTFMERALPVGAFAPARNVGAALSSTAYDERLTWATGIFANTDSYGEGSFEGGGNVTGRVTALPWYQDDGRSLVHIGGSASYSDPTDGIRFSERPEMHLAPSFVDTGELNADHIWLMGAEAAAVDGPFSLQGEYILADVHGGNNPTFDGAYVQASYFLTGEHRAYSKSSGAFSRVSPSRNFSPGKGQWGAWEIAARYSWLDLSEKGTTGGQIDDWTIGLNWYLNPHTRLMLNYVRTDLDDVGGADMFGTRLMIDF